VNRKHINTAPYESVRADNRQGYQSKLTFAQNKA